jgi:hypothetical protein
MAKKVRFVFAMVLVAMLVLQAGPALAQQGPSGQYEPEGQDVGEAFEGFGIVEFGGQRDGTPIYGLAVDPETGYYMEGDFDFGAFEGQRVFATGQISTSGEARVLQVESIEAAGTSDEGRTVTFELTTEGTVPDGESFYAYAPDGYARQLTDPDGDGVYTGELAFPAENYPVDQPIPLSIGGLRDAEYPNGYTLRDFGPTAVEDGQTLSATYAFGARQDEESIEPTTASASAGATTASASAGATTPEPTVFGEGAQAEPADNARGSIFEQGGALGFLPDSGGTAILVLAGGALLVGGGLLAFRFLGPR